MVTRFGGLGGWREWTPWDTVTCPKLAHASTYRNVRPPVSFLTAARNAVNPAGAAFAPPDESARPSCNAA